MKFLLIGFFLANLFSLNSFAEKPLESRVVESLKIAGKLEPNQEYDFAEPRNNIFRTNPYSEDIIKNSLRETCSIPEETIETTLEKSHFTPSLKSSCAEFLRLDWNPNANQYKEKYLEFKLMSQSVWRLPSIKKNLNRVKIVPGCLLTSSREEQIKECPIWVALEHALFELGLQVITYDPTQF
jgi:hypothetical protein